MDKCKSSAFSKIELLFCSFSHENESVAMILMEPQTVAAYSQAPSSSTSQICASNHPSPTCQTIESTLSSPSLDLQLPGPGIFQFIMPCIIMFLVMLHHPAIDDLVC